MIRHAKQKYKPKVELKFVGGNLRDTWKELKNMAAVNRTTDQLSLRSSCRGQVMSVYPKCLVISSHVLKNTTVHPACVI